MSLHILKLYTNKSAILSLLASEQNMVQSLTLCEKSLRGNNAF